MFWKNLEPYNDVFANIVNGLLLQGAQVVKEDALTDAQPFSMHKQMGKFMSKSGICRSAGSLRMDWMVQIVRLAPQETGTAVETDAESFHSS